MCELILYLLCKALHRGQETWRSHTRARHVFPAWRGNSNIKPESVEDGFIYILVLTQAKQLRGSLSLFLPRQSKGNYYFAIPEPCARERMYSYNKAATPKSRTRYHNAIHNASCVIYKAMYKKKNFSHVPSIWLNGLAAKCNLKYLATCQE